MFTEYGTIGSCFQRISGVFFFVFFLCNSLSRVSFGWSGLVKDLYLRPLDAGKLQQKYNSGIKPRSGSGGKSLDASTAGPPLPSTQEYCSPTHAGGSPTGSNCSTLSDFPKDTTKECWGQVGVGELVDVFEYFYVAVSDRARLHVQLCKG